MGGTASQLIGKWLWLCDRPGGQDHILFTWERAGFGVEVFSYQEDLYLHVRNTGTMHGTMVLGIAP